MEYTEGQGPAARRPVELANPRVPGGERSHQGAGAATSGDADEAQSDPTRHHPGAPLGRYVVAVGTYPRWQRHRPAESGRLHRRQDREGRGRYANRILPTLTDPGEVWRVAFDDGTFRTRYIKLYDDPGTGGSLCIVSKLPDGQEVVINYIPMSDLPEDDAEARIDVQRLGSLPFRRG